MSDDFTSANGTLRGRMPKIGPAWTVSGIRPPVLVDGAAVSASTGYAGMQLPSQPVVMTATVAWRGNPSSQMTMIMSSDPTIRIANAVHLNFSPAGFSVTLRHNSGAFAAFMSGQWSTPMPHDGTARTVVLAVKGTRVWVRGPSGEVFNSASPVVALAAGHEVIWEPNTGPKGAALLAQVSAAR